MSVAPRNTPLHVRRIPDMSTAELREHLLALDLEHNPLFAEVARRWLAITDPAPSDVPFLKPQA